MSFLHEFPYHNILILGLAKSGTAAARFLLCEHKNVRINDFKGAEADVMDELESLGAEIVLGSHPLSVLNHIEVIVKTPGIPYENPVLQEALNRDIPIITEIELTGYMTDGPIIGITGSNGKTTTTTLIGKILETAGQHSLVAGNIGVAATDAINHMKTGDKLVLELSSFQLVGTRTFRPNIAVLLNLYEAHLDYHHTFEQYVEAKAHIFANQTADDYLVYNADQHIVRETIQQAASLPVPFSTTTKMKNGAWADKTTIYFKEEAIMSLNDVALVGEHNLENILAAVAVAKISGADHKAIKEVLSTFSGITHRLQFVRELNNCKYYNDSKATNILAAKKALASFDRPIIWLAGGLDRGQTFDELLPALKKVKGVVAFGETKHKLSELASKAHVENIIMAEDVEEAAISAHHLSSPDDVVLLSPACASWDQYRTFEERGDMFIQAVHKLV